MSTGYLIHIVALGTVAAAALAPPRRPRLLAWAAYLVGFVVAEVPHLALALLAFSTAVAVGDGDVGADSMSLVLLGGAALTAVALVVLARRAIRARPAADAALRAGGVNRRAVHPAWWRTAATPLPIKPRAVERLSNLRYGDADRRQRLDVFRRRDRPDGGPVLVHFHGGGYFSGGKNREARAMLHHFAARGWVCISADYRLRPRARFEDHLADAQATLAWARAHAGEHGGDGSTVVVAGSSAGAHLASLCAMSATGHEPIAAAVGLYGYYGRYYGRDAAEEIASSPFALDGSTAPPFLLAHGTLDSYTSAEAARELAAKLRSESSGPVVNIELPGGQHGFDLLRSWRLAAVISACDAFFADLQIGTGAADPARSR